MKIEAIAIVLVGGVLAGLQLAGSADPPSPDPASAVARAEAAEAPSSSTRTAEPRATESTVAAAAGGFLFPIAEADAGSLVGLFGDPRDGGSRAHAGLDILAPRGTAVLAPLAGTVLDTSVNPRGGKVIWLADPKGSLRMLFAHLDAWEVEPGDRVAAGQRIGRVGNTGNAAATSPHLHFEIRRDGRAIDPRSLLTVP